ncbi:hypothetical protein G647_02039 [Cladophialophora carrionii CBS 160.54]|uniref:Peroxin/Ferlin domain-containing protein n=1 Tax=Cladophialophora carrionii CBS 160.54 TaxID=1279043 RepID=V9DSE9_9EURO|nr:uncharacterized protein G647_02039 [Cladophialophora carrionii CBS 160.54]ETI29586.1 hypothetical protein G647_02039 [Cladophialophora carrionii CBS 160.54]
MSDNVSKILTRIATHDGPADSSDHEISLLDTTDQGDEPGSGDEPRSGSPSAGTKELARNGTRDSLKGQFTRGRFAKYQQGRYHSKKDSVTTADEPSSKSLSGQHAQDVEAQPGTQTVDFASAGPVAVPVERGRQSADKRRRESRRLKEEVSEIDILYENQRGSFFCGIPLYSHSSLLPIDPGPWTNKDFKDSPVDITNAQVPDPSWGWAWKTWYVDMSHDVDEEGWQYSFAFGRNWVWHGTHPWFHSFVRRRRWLRKRVKRDPERRRGRPGTMGEAHNLTGDYFTIHSRRDRSPIDAVDGTAKTARPSSFISFASTIDINEPPEDIKDIASLLTALKLAKIDREKIEVVKKFVKQGGEELAYLKDHIPQIMSFLVFQTSRTQLLSYLKKTANEARQHRQDHEDEETPEGDAESRRIDNLLAAVDAANAEIGGLEYWSDRKHVLKTHDSDCLTMQTIATIFDQPAPKPKFENDPVHEIKGISEKADIPDESTESIFNATRTSGSQPPDETDEKLDEAAKREDKGKGRAYDSEDDQIEQDSIPRLGSDEVYVPDAED